MQLGKQIVGGLSQVFDNILAQPEFRAAITSQGDVVSGGTLAQFGEFSRAEFAMRGKVVGPTGIKMA